MKMIKIMYVEVGFKKAGPQARRPALAGPSKIQARWANPKR